MRKNARTWLVLIGVFALLAFAGSQLLQIYAGYAVIKQGGRCVPTLTDFVVPYQVFDYDEGETMLLYDWDALEKDCTGSFLFYEVPVIDGQVVPRHEWGGEKEEQIDLQALGLGIGKHTLEVYLVFMGGLNPSSYEAIAVCEYFDGSVAYNPDGSLARTGITGSCGWRKAREFLAATPVVSPWYNAYCYPNVTRGNTWSEIDADVLSGAFCPNPSAPNAEICFYDYSGKHCMNFKTPDNPYNNVPDYTIYKVTKQFIVCIGGECLIKQQCETDADCASPCVGMEGACVANKCTYTGECIGLPEKKNVWEQIALAWSNFWSWILGKLGWI